MEQNTKTTQPDNTALRTALWRALHVLKDDKPYVIEDTTGYGVLLTKWHGSIFC